MKYFNGIIFRALGISLFSLLLLSSFNLIHAANTYDALDLVIDTDLTSIKIGKNLSYFEDKTNSLTIEDISAEKFQKSFIVSKKDSLSLGYSRSTFWVKLNTINPTKQVINWYLEYEYPMIDYLTFFFRVKNDYEKIETGDYLPFSSRPVNYRNFVFPIKGMPGKHTYFLKVKSSGTILIKLVAWELSELNKKKDAEMPILWMSYGILLALVIYNLFIFFSVGEKAYIYLVLVIVPFIFFALITNGYANQYLWTNWTWWGNVCQPFFVYWIIVSTLEFTRAFLNSKENLPIYDKIFRVLVIITVLCFIFPFVGEYYYAIQLAAILSIIGSLVMIAGGTTALIRGYRQAYFYMGSWIFFLGGTLLMLFRVFAIIPDNYFTAWGYQIGFVVMALLFSLGIADMINIIRSEKLLAIDALSESEKKYRGIFENATEGIFQVGTDGKVLTANSAAVSIFGYDSAEDLVQNLINLDNQLFADISRRSEFQRLLGENGRVKDFEFPAFKKDGSIIDASVNLHSVTDENDGIIYYEGIIDDISHRKHAEALTQKNIILEELAISDGLTNIYNHKYIKERLNQEILESQRYNNDLSIIMFDIDHFKDINDDYGHQFGDKVLKKVASIFKSELRATDIPGRYGGEEFLIILPNINTKNAFITAERIRKTIEGVNWGNEELKITISGGISSQYSSGMDDLIRKADSLLYQAKKKGRNRIECKDRN